MMKKNTFFRLWIQHTNICYFRGIQIFKKRKFNEKRIWHHLPEALVIKLLKRNLGRKKARTQINKQDKTFIIKNTNNSKKEKKIKQTRIQNIQAHKSTIPRPVSKSTMRIEASRWANALDPQTCAGIQKIIRKC